MTEHEIAKQNATKAAHNAPYGFMKQGPANVSGPSAYGIPHFEDEEDSSEEEEESEDGFEMIRLNPNDFTSGITIAQIVERAQQAGEIEHVKGTLVEIPIQQIFDSQDE